MFAKWPILAEKASLRRVNAAWLSRSERRAYAYSTLRPPTFSGDSLASAVWLTVRPNGVMKLQDVILKAMAKKLSWGGPVGNRGYTPRSWRSWRRLQDDEGADQPDLAFVFASQLLDGSQNPNSPLLSDGLRSDPVLGSWYS